MVLVDTEGKIAFIGYPIEKDLEKCIETLLKGEKLESKAGGDEGEEGPCAYVELDSDKVREEMSRWETKIEELA